MGNSWIEANSSQSSTNCNNLPIGAQLRQARIERGLSLAEVGRRVYMNPDYISELERGLHEPNLRTLETLTTAYSVRVTLVATESKT